MNSRQETVNLYTKADEGRRLSLYLFHRELREEFAKVEAAEAEFAEARERQDAGRSGLRRWALILRDWFASDDAPTSTGNRSRV